MSDYRPSRVTLATLTHIPDQSGYYQNRFDVMRLSLESLIAHSPPGTDVLVFDNGSCEPVVDYLRSLRDAGGIAYLLLSRRNVGKIGAFQILFRAAPGEIILTAEFKISLLRAVVAKKLHCRAEVVRPGSQLCFVEASVEAETADGERKLVARASVTLAVLGADHHAARSAAGRR